MYTKLYSYTVIIVAKYSIFLHLHDGICCQIVYLSTIYPQCHNGYCFRASGNGRQSPQALAEKLKPFMSYKKLVILILHCMFI